MPITIRNAREHNLKDIDVEIGEGLTVVTGVSGSGKTSLVFDTLYHEARRRFEEIFSLGSAVRLAPADVGEIEGLGPAVAVGQNLLNRNPLSTLATASGLHPFLRLLFTHFAERRCHQCGTVLQHAAKDEIIQRLADLSRGSRLEIFAPLVRKTLGSHCTLLQALSSEFDPDRLRVDGKTWDRNPLDPHQLHDIAVRLTPDNEDNQNQPSPDHSTLRGYIDKAAALGSYSIWAAEAGKPGKLFSWGPVCVECGTQVQPLLPVDFNRNCPHCEGEGCGQCSGSGLPAQAASSRWANLRFTELLSLSVNEAQSLFLANSLPDSSKRLQAEITRRLEALQRVGLGYISLDRPSPSLSRGESQRVRIALTLISRLEDMLHVLDEPTVGQHPADIERLLPAFRSLAGPVIFVEHDRSAAAGADQAVDIGPGAGTSGGEIVFTGTPEDLWKADTATGEYFSLRKRPSLPSTRPQPQMFISIRGAHLRNLQEFDVDFPVGRLSVVTGVSGSGKSTLVEDVLTASLEAHRPTGCRVVISPHLKAVLVDQSPIGRNPRSNPATYTKLADIIRDLFAAGAGLTSSHFSFNRKEGACPECGGLGALEIAMRYLPSTWITCPECDGKRFSDKVLSRRMEFGEQHLNIAEFYDLSINRAASLFEQEMRIPEKDRLAATRILQALTDIGLGYLSLGQPSPSLSGGEAQRVKLARFLGQKSLAKDLLVLDEPSTGLHPQDLDGLLVVLDRLVKGGATIVIVEHNLDVIRSADWAVDLGPGAGPEGGRLLYAGPASGLRDFPGSLTGQALRIEEDLSPKTEPSGTRIRRDAIAINGARANNLKAVSVQIPKGKLTVVTGVSGSGKSSLVSDVLESEARRRYLETLSLYERQGTREGPEAEVDSVSGLGVALTIGPERLVYNRRATVGTATEISHHLAVLLSTTGERLDDPDAPLPEARYFTPVTYAAVCQKCNGVGTTVIPQPEKLIIHPEKPLTSGAMYSPGFFPNGYLGKPFNGGYYMLQALAEAYGFDPAQTPWNEMTPQAQNAFLFGTDEELTIHYESRKGSTSKTYRARFPGFYGFIRDWDVGGTYTTTAPCPECGGKRLRPQYLAVKLGGYDIYELGQMPLVELEKVLQSTGKTPARTRGQTRQDLAGGSLQTISRKLDFLIKTGLGYLHLDRIAGTLSAGEAQRIRLASVLGSGLTSLTLLLDEPSRGLHPSEVQALIDALRELRDSGNTVVIVEHDPLVMRSADMLIDVGPGAGEAGGTIAAQGTPQEVMQADTPTGRWLRGERGIEKRHHRAPKGWMILHGARANNLQGDEARFPLGTLTGICGVSGSGKSSLVIDTLGRALAPKKLTTSVAHEPVEPGEYRSIEGAPARALLVDQSRAGLVSPASFLNLTTTLRSIYAASEDAHALGIDESHLSARCSNCGGSGVISLDMAFLPDVRVSCETCRGTGFTAEAWDVRVHDLSLPEVFGLTIEQVRTLFQDYEALQVPLQAALDMGLGYLVLRQPGYALSGGEAQRLKLAAELSRKRTPESLFILDEPTVGLHLEDVAQLIRVLHRLVNEGATVLVVEHHAHLLSACDWLLELGPGGGPQGGRIIAQGTPEQLASGGTPTAPYLKEVLQ